MFSSSEMAIVLKDSLAKETSYAHCAWVLTFIRLSDNFSSPSFLYLKDRDMDKAFGLLKERGMTLFPVVDDDFKLMML